MRSEIDKKSKKNFYDAMRWDGEDVMSMGERDVVLTSSIFLVNI